MSIPLAITPMVAGKAPSCAAPSMPRARPETTVKPASASAALAPAGQDRRGAVEFRQQRGVIGLIVEQVARARTAHRGDFALDAFGTGRAVRPPAPAGEIGQGIERR